MPSTENTFAQRLKAARKKAHLTGTEFADITGINYQTYMTYEREKNGALPSVANLIKISNALGMSTDYLLKGTADEPKDISTAALSSSDIDLLLDEIEEKIRLDKNVNFQGKPLDAKTKKDVFIRLCFIQSDLAFGQSTKGGFNPNAASNSGEWAVSDRLDSLNEKMESLANIRDKAKKIDKPQEDKE